MKRVSIYRSMQIKSSFTNNICTNLYTDAVGFNFFKTLIIYKRLKLAISNAEFLSKSFQLGSRFCIIFLGIRCDVCDVPHDYRVTHSFF